VIGLAVTKGAVPMDAAVPAATAAAAAAVVVAAVVASAATIVDVVDAADGLGVTLGQLGRTRSS
jgi:hypothetical protein